LKRLTTKLMLAAPSGFILMLLMSGISLAEGTSNNGISDLGFTDKTNAMDSIKMVGQVIFFLIIIIALFLVLIKFLAKRNKYSIFGRSVRSLGGVPLGQNKSIQVVEIGHALFVVGVGENIQLLEKINDPEEVAYVTELLTVSQSENSSFATLGKLIGNLRGRNKELDEEVEITSSFQQVFHDKLQRVTSRNKHVEEWLSDQKQTDRSNDK
jgi:flagellar protein FliO/FliZ